MIEKFTKEEIDILRNELEHYDHKNKPQRKPYKVFYKEIYDLFSDRPGTTKTFTYATERKKNTALAVLRDINKITAYTLDCIDISVGQRESHSENYISITEDKQIPPEKYDEYCQMWEEIIEIIRNHIKPYTNRGRGKTWTF